MILSHNTFQCKDGVVENNDVDDSPEEAPATPSESSEKSPSGSGKSESSKVSGEESASSEISPITASASISGSGKSRSSKTFQASSESSEKSPSGSGKSESSKVSGEESASSKISPITASASISGGGKSESSKVSGEESASSESSPRIIEEGNPCDPNPCQNGGTCSPSDAGDGSYECACADGSISDNCEDVDPLETIEEGNPCDPNPCQNGGTCSPSDAGDGSYECACADGFVGDTCDEEDPSEPIVDPCSTIDLCFHAGNPANGEYNSNRRLGTLQINFYEAEGDYFMFDVSIPEFNVFHQYLKEAGETFKWDIRSNVAPAKNPGGYNNKLPYSSGDYSDSDTLTLNSFQTASVSADFFIALHIDENTGETIWAVPCGQWGAGYSYDLTQSSSYDPIATSGYVFQKFETNWGGFLKFNHAQSSCN